MTASPCRKVSQVLRHSASSSWGGGTNFAFPGRLPPIQFLARPEFPWLLPTASACGEKHLVDLTDETQAEGEALFESLQPVVQGRDVVGHLHHIVEGDPRGVLVLVGEEVREGGLRPLDLAGEHGLLANITVEEQGGVR